MHELSPPAFTLTEVLAAVLHRKVWQAPLNAGWVESQSLLAEAQLITNAVTGTYHLVPRDGLPQGVQPKAVYSIYEDHLVRRGSAGRTFYAQLKLLARDGLCPYCQSSVVDTLDHYLPKAQYPLLSIVPFNLIPCCYRCNKHLGEDAPSSPEDAKLNPYIDRFPPGRWLHAAIFPGSALALLFSAQAPSHWPTALRERVERQFEVLRLAELYAAEGSKVVTRMRRRLTRLGSTADRMAALDDELQLASSDNNSVETAVLEALRGSSWYVNTGFAV